MNRRTLLASASACFALKTTRVAFAAEEYKVTYIRLRAKQKSWTAALEDNAFTREFVKRLPMTLPMMDLYGRELCYRFPKALPVDRVEYRSYRLGEIVYWPPRHSLVILYEQNGEAFDMQSVGRIEQGIEELSKLGDAEVTITLVER